MDDPSAVRKAEPFRGSFPVLGPPTAISGKVHQRCAASLNAAQMILAGYEHNIDEVLYLCSLSFSNIFYNFTSVCILTYSPSGLVFERDLISILKKISIYLLIYVNINVLF